MSIITTNQAINTGTVMYGVFGDPISHSKSPLMLNRAFQETKLNAAYAAFHVLPGKLKLAIDGVRAMNFRGVNVTIPHKVEVMAYLDEIDEGARAIGAVNTIVNENGKLIGYNTDGIGFVRSMKEETGVSIAGKRILMLGAGGAARGIAYALAKEGAAMIWITNRTADKAVKLAESLGEFTKVEAIAADQLAGIMEQVDIIVNNTSIGMFPKVEGIPIDPELLHANLLVSDIVYTPRITRLLKEAQTKGAQIHSGFGMFIYQGAYAFEYWTGLPAPVHAMREVVIQSLGE